MNLQIKVHHESGKRFLASARNHSVAADVPTQAGGSDSAMTPLELLLAGLGTCNAFYASNALDSLGMGSQELLLDIAGDVDHSRSSITNVRVHVHVPGLDHEAVQKLDSALQRCTARNALAGGVGEIQVTIVTDKNP